VTDAPYDGNVDAPPYEPKDEGWTAIVRVPRPGASPPWENIKVEHVFSVDIEDNLLTFFGDDGTEVAMFQTWYHWGRAEVREQ
jgi:hypothetical protein